MALDGSWIPQTEAEARLMEDIHIATRRAYRDGVSPERIAALLAFMSSATLDPASEAQRQSDGESTPLVERMDETEGSIGECPDCGTEATDVRAHALGTARVEPCGCRLGISGLPEEWREALNPEEEEE